MTKGLQERSTEAGELQPGFAKTIGVKTSTDLFRSHLSADNTSAGNHVLRTVQVPGADCCFQLLSVSQQYWVWTGRSRLYRKLPLGKHNDTVLSYNRLFHINFLHRLPGGKKARGQQLHCQHWPMRSIWRTLNAHSSLLP